MAEDGSKRIADAVHGTIRLTGAEARIISSRAYQRMRGVKHLGLASLVFPGADYSRFAHGIGTLHVTGLVLDSLAANVPGSVTPEDERLYRMAALLHDIGHYPFSHTFERALKDHYSSSQLLQPVSQSGAPPPTSDGLAPQYWYHEELGTHVILEDSEIREVLESVEIDPDQLTRIIAREDPPKYTNLISSDLDADRTDYLMRTALHTGLPYGNVDLPYLLSQIRLDDADRICFTQKGMRAAEHLLLSRYFDYQQVSYHKTVAGLELVLNDAVGVLLSLGLLECHPDTLQAMMQDGRWYDFDDAFVTGHIRDAMKSPEVNDRDRLLFSAILDRRPPKVVADREFLGQPAIGGSAYKTLDKLARKHVATWRAKYDLPFYIWNQSGNRLTKIGSMVAMSAIEDAGEDGTYDKVQQAVRILGADGKSKPIQEDTRSLISVLSQHALYSVRVYALIPPEREEERSAIERAVNEDLMDMWI